MGSRASNRPGGHGFVIDRRRGGDLPKGGVRVSGFGFRVLDFEFRVSGFGIRVAGLGFRV